MIDFVKNPVIRHYKNGDFKIMLLRDGTKIRMSNKENPKPDFPENIDLKLTNRCDLGCAFCHENSTPDGKDGYYLDYDNCFAHKFLYSLPHGTEVALGGGALSTLRPEEFKFFLDELWQNGVVANMTINQFEIPKMEEKFDLSNLVEYKLIHGIGVSYRGYKDEKFLKFCKKYPGVVVHVINGIFNEEDYEYLKDRGLKLLILGYKDLRRGHDYKNSVNEIISENQKWLSDNIMEVQKHFEVVSFDNLAVSQLGMKNKISKEEWDINYMDDDGTHTMYIDLPNNEFSVSSTHPKRWKINDMKIQDMFKIVQEEVESGQF